MKKINDQNYHSASPILKWAGAGILLLFMMNGLVATQINLSFAEVARSADLIFIGTVENQESRFNEQQTLIITEVLFSDIVIVHSTHQAVQDNSSFVILQHAGGCVGDLCLDVSVAPSFQPGHRYLLFVSDDGKTYINPLIGGPQGFFEVVKDVVTGEEFVLTAGRKYVRGGDARGLTTGRLPVAYIQGGAPVYEPSRADVAVRSVPAPTPHHPLDTASLSSAGAEPADQNRTAQPFCLSDFIHYIKEEALKTHLEMKILKREESDISIKKRAVRIESKTFDDWITQNDEETGHFPANDSAPFGGTLGYCGYHTLPFVLETVPSDWWSYDTIEASRQTWNWFMGVYQKRNSDGKYGHNGINEFCGWVKDADMFRIYGVHWNGYIAWAHSWWRLGSPCGRLLESDILFNPAYDWTDSEENAWGNSNVILLRPLAMHEVAHTWGMQRGESGQWGYHETYDYDQLTVVHKYYHDLIEDGRGIHVADAYCFRRDYSKRTNIKNTVDVGVESYYASNGLHNATTNSSSYYPGDQISLENITVENISYNDVSDVRVRFYLSKDRTIKTDDYKIGSFWNWETLDGETHSVFDISSTIPDDVPAGTYYIGIIITVNGYQQDDYTHNNRTSFFATITIKAKGSSNNGGDGKSGRCFIATAAFNSPLHPYVTTLRNFRDTYLVNSEFGRGLVDAYYRYSPPMARLISKHRPLKAVVQRGLLPLVAVCHTILSLGAFF
jgi:hypothetical protein